MERHIQDCCVLVSSLSVLVIQSYHNPPSSISRVNPCNVRLQLRSISDESGVKLPLAIIIQLSTLTLSRQLTRHYQLSTTNYCLFTILISEHHRKSELPLGCFSVSAIGIILSETVKSAIIKSQSVSDIEELPLTTWGPSSNTGQGGECSPVVGVVGAQGWNAGLVLLNFQTRSRPGFSEGFDDTLYIHFSVN